MIFFNENYFVDVCNNCDHFIHFFSLNRHTVYHFLWRFSHLLCCFLYIMEYIKKLHQFLVFETKRPQFKESTSVGKIGE